MSFCRHARQRDIADGRVNHMIIEGIPVLGNAAIIGLGQAGMPHIRLHDLRHSAATNMHELSGDFFTGESLLGHSLNGLGFFAGLSDGATGQYK